MPRTSDDDTVNVTLRWAARFKADVEDFARRTNRNLSDSTVHALQRAMNAPTCDHCGRSEGGALGAGVSLQADRWLESIKASAKGEVHVYCITTMEPDAASWNVEIERTVLVKQDVATLGGIPVRIAPGGIRGQLSAGDVAGRSYFRMIPRGVVTGWVEDHEARWHAANLTAGYRDGGRDFVDRVEQVKLMGRQGR